MEWKLCTLRFLDQVQDFDDKFRKEDETLYKVVVQEPKERFFNM